MYVMIIYGGYQDILLGVHLISTLIYLSIHIIQPGKPTRNPLGEKHISDITGEASCRIYF